jgi:autotransporter passenger strand-loop-strand repeat protein
MLIREASAAIPSLTAVAPSPFFPVARKSALRYTTVSGAIISSVLNGGSEIVSSGGIAIDVAVSSGGFPTLFGGAVAEAYTIGAGGTLEIGSGYNVGRIRSQ